MHRHESAEQLLLWRAANNARMRALLRATTRACLRACVRVRCVPLRTCASVRAHAPLLRTSMHVCASAFPFAPRRAFVHILRVLRAFALFSAPLGFVARNSRLRISARLRAPLCACPQANLCTLLRRACACWRALLHVLSAPDRACAAELAFALSRWCTRASARLRAARHCTIYALLRAAAIHARASTSRLCAYAPVRTVARFCAS